jgi:hypothetical protein
MLLEFDTVTGAVKAVLEAHRQIRAYNLNWGLMAELHLRSGVHDAEVVNARIIDLQWWILFA